MTIHAIAPPRNRSASELSEFGLVRVRARARAGDGERRRVRLAVQAVHATLLRADGSRADADGGSGDGWVLCGLIAQRALSADSYAVSFSILVLLSAVLLLGLLSWPFLKLMLLGEAQRVKAHDIVLVAICTLLGISLVTIGTLDFFAYGRRLRSALDVCTDGAVEIVHVVSLVERRV